MSANVSGSHVDINFRHATPSDSPAIMELVRDLAAMEAIEVDITLTPERLTADCFTPAGSHDPAAYNLVAYRTDGEEEVTLVGYLMWLPSYSPLRGRVAILEDFYVRPEFRGVGIGQNLVQEAIKHASQIIGHVPGHMDLVCQGSNCKSIAFYEKLGACNVSASEGWNVFRFDQSALERLLQKKDKE